MPFLNLKCSETVYKCCHFDVAKKERAVWHWFVPVVKSSKPMELLHFPYCPLLKNSRSMKRVHWRQCLVINWCRDPCDLCQAFVCIFLCFIALLDYSTRLDPTSVIVYNVFLNYSLKILISHVLFLLFSREKNICTWFLSVLLNFHEGNLKF